VLFFVNKLNADGSTISVPKVGSWSENIRSILRDGHQVYSHTASHTYFDKKGISSDTVSKEIEDTMAMEDELRQAYEDV